MYIVCYLNQERLIFLNLICYILHMLLLYLGCHQQDLELKICYNCFSMAPLNSQYSCKHQKVYYWVFYFKRSQFFFFFIIIIICRVVFLVTLLNSFDLSPTDGLFTLLLMRHWSINYIVGNIVISVNIAIFLASIFIKSVHLSNRGEMVESLNRASLVFSLGFVL